MGEGCEKFCTKRHSRRDGFPDGAPAPKVTGHCADKVTRSNKGSGICESTNTASPIRFPPPPAARRAPPARASMVLVVLAWLAGGISQTMQALSSQSAQRVGQLRKDFQAGRYRPAAPQSARAIARVSKHTGARS